MVLSFTTLLRWGRKAYSRRWPHKCENLYVGVAFLCGVCAASAQKDLGQMNNRARSCIVDAYSDHQIGPVSIKRLDKDLPLPQRAHRGDAGVDLYATENIQIQPGHRALVGTGVALALPLGTVGLIHPRSGRALKEGLSIVNAPGTIDADYRGEIKVCLINLDPQTPISIERGQRIAQLVIQKVELVDFIEVEELDDTVRGSSGYGSTGVN
ncbi:Deoxyuridine 5'-triphosphate nucleotidohydrolase [Corynebacterium ulcerans]|nr:Deoxyuridine 5'-triphosphate nucleotidohydrolase [Corynebacterium ulcerans]